MGVHVQEGCLTKKLSGAFFTPVGMGNTLHMRTTYVNGSLTDNSWANWMPGDATDGTIYGDQDGDMSDPTFIIDLGKAMSESLGKQLPGMAIYRLSYVRLQLQNKDDGSDNDAGQVFGGYTRYFEPTAHRINAMKLARETERWQESIDVDDNSFILRQDNDYTGMRFNMTGDGQVNDATTHALDNLTGSEWQMDEVFQAVENMLGTDHSSVVPDNALWGSAAFTRLGDYNGFGFSVGYRNQSPEKGVGLLGGGGEPFTSFIWDPESHDFELDLGQRHMDVLGGLMMFTINRSATNEPGLVADDYEIRVTIGVEGWSGF